MTGSNEPGGFAPDPAELDAVACEMPHKLGCGLTLAIFALAVALFPWFLTHVLRLPAAPILKIMTPCEIGFLAWLTASYYGFRVQADSAGLRWRKLFREKSVSWDGVTDYYVNYEPGPTGDVAFPFTQNWMCWVRMYRPEQLTAVIETRRGPVELFAGAPGREAICRMVRQRAMHAPVTQWEARLYRVPDGTRTFVYQPVPRRTLVWRILLGQFGQDHAIAPTVVTYEVLGSLLFICLLSRLTGFRSNLPDSAILLYLLIFACANWVLNSIFLVRWHRDCQRLLGEKLIVTETAFIRETATGRQTLNWRDITDLRPISPWRSLRYEPWRVRTADAEFQFVIASLHDGQGLPAIIHSRSPKLWGKLEPIASPIEEDYSAGTK